MRLLFVCTGTAWLAQSHKRLCDHRHNILSVSGIFQSDCARSHTIIAAPFWRPWLAQFTAGVSSKHGLELKLSSNAVTTPYQQEDLFTSGYFGISWCWKKHFAKATSTLDFTSRKETPSQHLDYFDYRSLPLSSPSCVAWR